VRPVAAQVVEEPQPIALDRTADREVGVPVLDESRRLRDPDTAQVIIEVAALRPLAGVADERGATVVVAAGLGNDVEGRPAAVALAHAAGDRHLHFLRVHEVVGEARDAAAAKRGTDVHAVHLNRAFVATPAPRREEEIRGGPGHRLGGVHVERQRLDPWHHRQDVAVGPCGRHLGEHSIGEHDLTFRARLRIDDGRRAGDGNRLGDLSHSQVGIDRRHAGAGQLDALAPDRRESGERERHGIGTGFQINDSILPGPIGHNGARLFDEHRTRGFHVHAGQDGARGVPDEAGDCWLGKRGCREKK
jgi:hypothetical protein